jgi:hypothetical protein
VRIATTRNSSWYPNTKLLFEIVEVSCYSTNPMKIWFSTILPLANPTEISLIHPNNILLSQNSNFYLNSYIFRDITNIALFSIANPKKWYSYTNPSIIQTHWVMLYCHEKLMMRYIRSKYAFENSQIFILLYIYSETMVLYEL